MSYGDPCVVDYISPDGSLVVSAVPPSTPTTNMVWWDTATRTASQWDGVQWLPMDAVQEAPLNDGPYGRENTNWVPLFGGFNRIEIVNELPATQLEGVLYLVKGNV